MDDKAYACGKCGVVMESLGEDEWLCPQCGEVYWISESDEDDESLSVDEAAEIWASHGMDEDYTFGFSEEELRGAL